MFGVVDAFRGQLPLGLLVLNSATVDQCDEKEVIREAIDRVRAQIGAFAVFKKAVIVAR